MGSGSQARGRRGLRAVSEPGILGSPRTFLGAAPEVDGTSSRVVGGGAGIIPSHNQEYVVPVPIVFDCANRGGGIGGPAGYE